MANQVTAERLEYEHKLREIRQEWGHVARGLDKIFLFLFITFTVVYQMWLLAQTNLSPRKISEEFMNRTSSSS